MLVVVMVGLDVGMRGIEMRTQLLFTKFVHLDASVASKLE